MRTSKRLIVCCDGTWNNPADHTNIDWIATHCQGLDAEPIPQEVLYLPGVGTAPGEELLGGGVGLGLSRVTVHFPPDFNPYSLQAYPINNRLYIPRSGNTWQSHLIAAPST